MNGNTHPLRTLSGIPIAPLYTPERLAAGGFDPAQATNARYRFLLAHGQTGLSTDFAHTTLTGYDSDHEPAAGE